MSTNMFIAMDTPNDQESQQRQEIQVVVTHRRLKFQGTAEIVVNGTIPTVIFYNEYGRTWFTKDFAELPPKFQLSEILCVRIGLMAEKLLSFYLIMNKSYTSMKPYELRYAYPVISLVA